MAAVLAVDASDPLQTEAGGPHVVLMVGVNGAGKTTSAAKLARLYLDQDKKVLLAAADTFRAAAIDQLQEWGRRLDLDVIAHQPGSDAAAVAFDAVEAAFGARGRRRHRRHRGPPPHEVQPHGGGPRRSTGSSRGASPRSRRLLFSRSTPPRARTVCSRPAPSPRRSSATASFSAKLDSSAKGGIVFAIASELRIPVLFIGTGEQPDDIAPFDAETFVESLFAEGGSA